MTFDTPQQTDYLMNLLGARRDEIHDKIIQFEKVFTDHVILHDNERYKSLKEELDLNATLTVRIMNEEIQMKREVKVLSN